MVVNSATAFIKSHLARAAFFLLMAMTVVGCAKNQLRIVTDPSESLITVKQGDKTLIEGKPSPVEVNVDFSGKAPLAISATPVAAISDRFVPANHTLDSTGYFKLPLTGEKVRDLTLKMEARNFVDVTYVDVVVDSDSGLVALAARARAMKSTTEEGGRAPSKVIDLDPGLGIRGLSMSPDGKRIVFSLASIRDSSKIDLDKLVDTPGSNQELNIQKANLRAASLAGGGLEELTSDSFIDTDPCYTVDGKNVLMASNRRRANSSDILRISSLARGGGIQDIYTDRTRGGRVANITQGSNGLIAFCLYPSGTDPQIWTIGGNEGFPTELGQGINPAISPDGKKIAFIRNGDLYVMNSDGTGATQLTFDGRQILERFDQFIATSGDPTEKRLWAGQREYFQPNSSPTWSPDGKAIAFSSSRSVDSDGRPNEDIYVIPVDGGEPRQLTTNRSTDRNPMFAPGSDTLYFISNRGGFWAIWRIPLGELTK